MRMSKHIITKSEGFKKHKYVDAAGVIRRLFTLPGEVSLFIQTKGEVSRGHSSSHKAAKDRTADRFQFDREVYK